MNKLFRLSIGSFVLATTLLFSGNIFAQGTAPKDAAKAATKTAASSMPSDKEIADAKAKGLVWVNTNSKVYHKDGQFYGKTKQGQFMTEAEAQKAGNHAAKSSPIGAKKSADGKK